jgi:hypothetical protein
MAFDPDLLTGSCPVSGLAAVPLTFTCSEELVRLSWSV